MALSKADALDSVRAIINGPRASEMPRLDRIADALAPCGPDRIPNVILPKDPKPQMLSLARKSETNYLPLILDVFNQGMKGDGLYSKTTPGVAGPFKYWQRNGWDARQSGVHRAALQYGVAYTTVLPGDKGPVWRGISPRNMTALYRNPADDDVALMALHIDGTLIKLYDDECVYRFGMEPTIKSILSPALSAQTLAGNMVYIDTLEHGNDGCPVHRFRDRMLLDGEEQLGIIEPLITLQQRINETTFEMLVAQYFGAFRQKYLMGWLPANDEEYLQATASDVWAFEDPEVKAGEFTETDITRYIESRSSAIRDLSAIAQLPAQSLGVDGISNISDATLAGLEVAKERKTDEIETSFGETYEMMFRSSAALDGDMVAAEDYESELKWKASTARAFAATVDALGKLGTMLHVPDEVLWEMVPGLSNAQIAEAKRLRESAGALAGLTNLLGPQSDAPAS